MVPASMESDGEYEKAAGWALFHSSSLTRAIQALNKSNSEYGILGSIEGLWRHR